VTDPDSKTASQPASLTLVLAAALYDCLLSAGILFIATALAVLANSGQAIASGEALFKLYLFAAGFPYFAWCWTRSGQTLGMKTWKLKLQRCDGTPIRMHDAALRYLGAALSWVAFALGFVWIALDSRGRSWHDIISNTRIVKL
jgi:uncharacterized RDD family membrane protein YckC